MMNEKEILETRYGMKVKGLHRTRKGANSNKRMQTAFSGGSYTVKKVESDFFSTGCAFVLFEIMEASQ